VNKSRRPQLGVHAAIGGSRIDATGQTANRWQGAEIWWINPWKLGLFFLLPIYVVVYAAPWLFGPDIATVRFRSYFDTRFFLLGLAFLLILIAWAVLFVQLDIGRSGIASGKEVKVNPLFLDALAIAAIGAYMVWFHHFILNPGALFEVFSGQWTAIFATRAQNPTIPGVTTATQFAVAYVIFFLHARFINGCKFPSSRYQFYFWTLIGLTVFRVYAWGERLALMEIAAPAAVLITMWGIQSKQHFVRRAVKFAPFIALPLLVLFFGATEFFRSWGFYKSLGTPFWEFVLTRVMTYYYTALNNGAGMLAILDWPTWQFDNVLGWLHHFPFFVGEHFRFLIGAVPQRDFLESFADPEFNNPAAVFVVFQDIGLPLGFLYAAVWGAALGFWYRQMLRGEGLGSFMYPACYVSLLEILRILYLGNQRAFPVLLAILLGYFFFSSRQLRIPRPRRTASRPHESSRSIKVASWESAT
jgi:hypothetical protein